MPFRIRLILPALIMALLMLAPSAARAAPGEIEGHLPVAGGAAAVVWGGGDTDALAAAAAEEGCGLRSVWVFISGDPLGFLFGAPPFVNSQFLASFPAGEVAAGTIAILRCEAIVPVPRPSPTTIRNLPVPTSPAAVGPVPVELGLDGFYEKYVDAGSIPVVSSAAVPDAALLAARAIVLGMLQGRPDIAAMISSRGVRVGVIGANENTTDIPEYADLDSAYWDARSRGLGATSFRPITTAGEENLLCYQVDRYRGESILVHEFAHTILQFGVSDAGSSVGLVERVQTAYVTAMEADLWTETYAATNYDEYWAEAVQSWFDANLESIPSDGIHNHVNTQAELRTYDGTIASLIKEALPSSWQLSCP